MCKFVKIKQKMINGLRINDYQEGSPEILDIMKPYTIAYTQKEAGFKVNTREHVLEVELEPISYKLSAQLKKDKVIQGSEEVVLGDTPVKLMNKLHQLFSGTIKFESGKAQTIDLSKAKFIKEHFKGKKIGIFYKFKQELKALQEVFGKENITDDIGVFKDTDNYYS